MCDLVPGVKYVFFFVDKLTTMYTNNKLHIDSLLNHLLPAQILWQYSRYRIFSKATSRIGLKQSTPPLTLTNTHTHTHSKYTINNILGDM